MNWIERGGPVMWPLLILSLIATTLVVERILFWLRESRRPPAEALAELSVHSPNAPRTQAELDILLEVEQRRLERGMALLDTIVAASPMLGILGTVLGVISAFEALASNVNPDPMAVTGGISQALITTAFGLMIALSVLFPFGYLRTRVRLRLSMLEQCAHEEQALTVKA